MTDIVNATVMPPFLQALETVGISWVLGIIFLLILIIALFIALPLWYDSKRAYDLNEALLKKMEDIDKFSLSDDGKKEILANLITTISEPRGVVGTTRRTMALTVLLVLGISFILMLFFSTDTQVTGNIMSMLGATLAAVVGFYFGGTQARDLVNQVSSTANTAPAKETKAAASLAALAITSVTPGTGYPGVKILTDIFGSGFKSGAEVILKKESEVINGTKVTVINQNQIQCAFQLSSNPGKWDLIITNTGGESVTRVQAFEILKPVEDMVKLWDKDNPNMLLGWYYPKENRFEPKSRQILSQIWMSTWYQELKLPDPPRIVKEKLSDAVYARDKRDAYLAQYDEQKKNLADHDPIKAAKATDIIMTLNQMQLVLDMATDFNLTDAMKTKIREKMQQIKA